jgi:hypothetical protein
MKTAWIVTINQTTIIEYFDFVGNETGISFFGEDKTIILFVPYTNLQFITYKR